MAPHKGNLNSLGPKETKALREDTRPGVTEPGAGERAPGPQEKKKKKKLPEPLSDRLQRAGN